MNLKQALENPKWKAHKIGDTYSMTNRDGRNSDNWKIAYYPLFGTYKNDTWIEFDEPRVLIERPLNDGIDFREIPFRYLTKTNKHESKLFHRN